MGALVGLGGGAPTPDSSQAATVRVLSAAHRIEFPDRIVLNLEAEPVEDVADVRLFYTLGGQDTVVYGYPTVLDGSDGVAAEFVIPTRSPNFIPAGVDIRYHYVFRQSDGSLLETDTFTVEYLDPRYDWERYDAGAFEVLWHDRPRSLVEGVADEVSVGLRPALEMFGLKSPGKMKAVIVNGGKEAGRTFPRVSQAASDGHLYGGFAFGDYDVFALAGLSVDGMLHEMTHLLIDEAIDSPRAKVPAWLNEGIAMHFERGSRRRESSLSRAAASGSLIPLHSMGSVPGRPEDVRLFYAQSESIVTFMVETYGAERMSSMLQALNGGQSIEASIQSAYGVPITQIEADWKEGVRSSESFSHGVDPGSFGTSIIVTGAVLVTATALAVRWLRRVLNAEA